MAGKSNLLWTRLKDGPMSPIQETPQAYEKPRQRRDYSQKERLRNILNQSIGGTSRGSRRNSGMTESEYDLCSPSKIDDNRSRRRVITPELSKAGDNSPSGMSRRVQFGEIKIFKSGEDHSQIHRSTNNSPLKRPTISPTKSHKHNSSMEIDDSQSQFATSYYRSPGGKVSKTSDQSHVMERSYYRQNS